MIADAAIGLLNKLAGRLGYDLNLDGTDGNNPVDALGDAVRDGDRSALARAITLVESTRADRREQAQELLLALMPDAAARCTSASPAYPAWASRPPLRRSVCT